MSKNRTLHGTYTTLEMKKMLAIEALGHIDLDGDITNWVKNNYKTIRDIMVGGDNMVVKFDNRNAAKDLLNVAYREENKNNVIEFGWSWLQTKDKDWWLLLSWDYREIRQDKGESK